MTDTKNIPTEYQSFLGTISRIIQEQIEMQAKIVKVVEMELEALKKRVAQLENSVDKLTKPNSKLLC